MNIDNFKCTHSNECYSSGTTKCSTCVYNTKRNYIKDFYKKADDNKIPYKCPRLHYAGPAEQTDGYQCPVCHGYTNPYQLGPGNSCSHCGYRLNINS